MLFFVDKLQGTCVAITCESTTPSLLMKVKRKDYQQALRQSG
jgi:hypothetical protein